MPSSLSEQPSRTYKGRLFHFLNRTNLFFLNYCLKDFIQSFNQHTIFFFLLWKCFPVTVRTQLLSTVSKEKETDGWTSELSYVSTSSNPTLLKRKSRICLLQLLRKTTSYCAPHSRTGNRKCRWSCHLKERWKQKCLPQICHSQDDIQANCKAFS